MTFTTKKIILLQLLTAVLWLSAALSPILTQAQSKKKNISHHELVKHSPESDLEMNRSSEPFIWTCENNLQIKTALSKNADLLLLWNKKLHTLQIIQSLPGSQRYHDPVNKLDWLVISDKAMLFDAKAGQRIADYCKTEEMRNIEASNTK